MYGLIFLSASRASRQSRWSYCFASVRLSAAFVASSRYVAPHRPQLTSGSSSGTARSAKTRNGIVRPVPVRGLTPSQRQCGHFLALLIARRRCER